VSESTSSQIAINATADEVFAVIAAIEDYPEWTDGMKNIVVTQRDSQGRALTAEFDIAGGPISDRVTLEYTWEPLQVSWKLAHGTAMTKLSGQYSLRAVGEETQVTYSLEVDVALAIPSFLKRTAEKQIIATALHGLKKRVEATS
jgi:ribosome-associated toxin RatA of RatAB toxin-antitoxin module